VTGVGRRVLLLALGVGTALALCPAAGAQVVGNQSADRWVTIAARECDDYSDIRANLARNNIQESLQDLGQDTLYVSGEPVDPRKELAGQPTCRPITGWRFTFGDGIAGNTVDGSWGKLSVVTDPDGGQQPVTKASVPARDFNGNPVGGGAKIAGAVTIGLTRAQVDRSSGGSLWLQGGTVADPVLFSDPQFAGAYGFGALRCAIDDLNGDNVETIQFPSGTRHMYCYAYYVTPPPSSGSIVIRKQVEGADAAETFGFGGNVSYNEGGVFDLTASEGDPDSIEFVRAETRAGDAPWTVSEDAHEGWRLTGLSCSSQSGSTTVTSLAARRVQITLVAGDTVTCTFTNRLAPVAGALVLRKVTRGGTGSFPFRIRNEDGDVVARRTLTTESRGGVGAVGVIRLDPGRYRISERRPASGRGVWRLTGVKCNGSTRAPDAPVEITISAGRGAVCTFTNRLKRPGRIIVRAVTIGGVGTAGYVITPFSGGFQRRQLATTRRQGRAFEARGEPTRGLAFGRFVLQETAITAAQRQVWTLIAVSCNDRVVPFEQGRVVVRVTRRAPVQRCTFVNLRQRDPDPPPDPDPDPDVDPTPDPVPGGGTPDLALTKRRVGSTGGPIPTLTFRLRVTNRSDVTANRVVVADRLAAGTVLVSARPSQGRCFPRGARLVICPLGDLDPGASATIRVRVQQVDPGAGVNVAATGASSPEDVLRNNVASARIAAIQRPPGACPASAPARAHAAC
jgi:uncharacterized repeat protein (TIGR01451 family)